MPRYVSVLVLAVVLSPVVTGCSAGKPVVNAGDEPHFDCGALTRANDVFSFGRTPDGVVLAANEVRLDEVIVRVTAPEGWEGSAVGNAVWMSFGDTRARFVIYPPDGPHGAAIRARHGFDCGDGDRQTGPMISNSSGRQPYLYLYREPSTGRRGLVYAVLTDPVDASSGIMVTGVWPEEMDCEMRRITLEAANSVTILPFGEVER